jgi:branched-chain amino acid transport system permease protein
VLLVVMVALGGWGNYWGPVFGALIYTAMPELLRKFQDAELFLFGLCMIVVLLYLPGGVAALFARRTSYARRASRAAPRPEAPAEARDGAA